MDTILLRKLQLSEHVYRMLDQSTAKDTDAGFHTNQAWNGTAGFDIPLDILEVIPEMIFQPIT